VGRAVVPGRAVRLRKVRGVEGSCGGVGRGRPAQACATPSECAHASRRPGFPPRYVHSQDDKIKKTAINCLQQYREELKSDKCKAEIHRRLTRAARDIRFDEVLASACTDDRNRFCADVQPVSGAAVHVTTVYCTTTY
jgi:hypothetical protein